MTKNKQLLLELSKRISILEKIIFDKSEQEKKENADEISYKEVLDEWLNGKRT